jgi:hypothetical protein
MRSIRVALLLSVAIAIALTSGAYAVQQITGRQIKNSTITGKDVKNKSLTRRDFRGGRAGSRARQARPA